MWTLFFFKLSTSGGSYVKHLLFWWLPFCFLFISTSTSFWAMLGPWHCLSIVNTSVLTVESPFRGSVGQFLSCQHFCSSFRRWFLLCNIDRWPEKNATSHFWKRSCHASVLPHTAFFSMVNFPLSTDQENMSSRWQPPESWVTINGLTRSSDKTAVAS